MATADRHWNDRLVGAWEDLHGASTAARATGLLQAVWPLPDPLQWNRASLGQRDACLFHLHESLFGCDLHTVADCPACGERLESQLLTRNLSSPPPTAPPAQEPQCFEYRDYRVRYRLPSSEDLQQLPAASASATGIDTAVAFLLQRCVLHAEHCGRSIPHTLLPQALVERLTERMAEQDPLADLRLAVQCPACSHQWTAGLDIAAYLWEELDDWVHDLLAQVDALARRYAWSERDILALSPVRRRFYLERLQA